MLRTWIIFERKKKNLNKKKEIFYFNSKTFRILFSSLIQYNIVKKNHNNNSYCFKLDESNNIIRKGLREKKLPSM